MELGQSSRQITYKLATKLQNVLLLYCSEPKVENKLALASFQDTLLTGRVDFASSGKQCVSGAILPLVQHN